MRGTCAWSHAQAPSVTAETLVRPRENLRNSVTERYGGSAREALLTLPPKGRRLAVLPATINVLRVTRAPALRISAFLCALRHAAVRRHDVNLPVELMTVVVSVHARMRTVHVVQPAM